MKKLDRFALGFFKPKEKLNCHDWAVESVELSPRITEQPGPYSTRLHPYVPEILNCMSNSKVKKVSLCWGSQTAKTTSFYVMAGFSVDQSPRAILWVFPNEKLCRNFASERWLPFCRDSKVLAHRLPRLGDGSIDPDKFTLLKQEFSRCTMNLVGAGSSANVRSYPISILILDEIDVIDEATRRECLDRTKGKTDWKILQSSTPIKESGGIWGEYLDGDRRRYFMPCPHCAEKIEFRWRNGEGQRNIIWSDDAKIEDGFNLALVQKSARYICENCAGEIRDRHKTKMLRDGEWVPTSTTAEDGVRSYHLNSIYSPVLTFGRIAAEYLKSKSSPEAARTFVNGWLAEPWKADTGTIDPAKFKAVQKDYERGEMRGKYRLLGVDVQRNYLVWVCRGFDVDGTSWLIDNGTAAVFEDLTALMERYEVSRGIVDTGYRTQEVYEFIHNSRPFWFGAKGWETMPTSYRIAKLDPFTPSTGGSPRRHGKRAITLLHINKKIWQEEMLLKRSGAAQNWWTYSPIDNEYLRQILSVQLVEKVNKTGRLVRQFVTEGHRQDHFWDAETYTLAMSNVFGLGGGVMKGQDLLEEKPPVPQHKPRAQQSAGASFWDS